MKRSLIGNYFLQSPFFIWRGTTYTAVQPHLWLMRLLAAAELKCKPFVRVVSQSVNHKRLNINQLISNLFTVFEWFMYYLAVLLALLNAQLTFLCLLLWLFIVSDGNGNNKPSILLLARFHRLVWSLVCLFCCLFTFEIEEADLLHYELNVSLTTGRHFLPVDALLEFVIYVVCVSTHY